MNGTAGWLASLAAGLTLWTGAAIAEGGREPWDTGAYWAFYLPVAALLCLLLGVLFPERAWRWPLAVMFAQLPVMILSGGEIGPLVIIGAALLLTLSLPGMLLAMLGSGVRRLLKKLAA